MRMKQRPKIIDVLLGLSIPVIGVTIYMFAMTGFDIWIPVQALFGGIFMLVAPLISQTATWVTLLIAVAFAVSFVVFCKYIPSPYLRFAIAAHSAAWWMFAVPYASMMS